MAERTFVVGDLHGCLDELNALLDGLQLTATDTMIFLGDYIDRGPESRGVVDRLIGLRSEGPRCVFLKGNHEDMFLGYMGLGGHYPDAFLVNGGKATLRSYGFEGCSGKQVVERLSTEHREFMLSLQNYVTAGEFLCVHAGIHPLRALDEQLDEDLFWIRDEFIRNRHRLPYIVLFGHTPQREVFMDLPYKIGLDTGLVYANKLSCLELGAGELTQIRRGDWTLRRTNLAPAIAAAVNARGR